MNIKTICGLNCATAAVMLFDSANHAVALPTGFTVQNGVATFNINGQQLTVNAGNNAQINWSSFNIAGGERTVFNQPSPTSIVWNRVDDPNPSLIYGSIQANGVVVLLNQSGFYFGPNSFVSAAGLVVSTANCTPPQNFGGAWEFNGPPPLASIVNFGTIKVGDKGSVFLIADKIENHGDIEAPGGSIGFAAGQTVRLSERPDGRGMSMDVVLPKGAVNNYGNIVADGGVVALNAKVVNQDGLIQADSVRNKNGVIELVAADELSLGDHSKIFARGDNSAAGSAGGNVTLKSENIFRDTAPSSIVTTGGAHGGNGGNVEVSAPTVASIASAMDAHAQPGSTGGEFLLDPQTIVIGTSGNGAVPASGTVGAASPPGTLNLDISTAFANKKFSNIKLQATRSIKINDGTIWDLSGMTAGVTSGHLSLESAGDVTFGNNSLITDSGAWTLSVVAGVNFSTGAPVAGTGNIFLNGGNGRTLSGAVQMNSGDVNLLAGNNIVVGTGYVRTTGGGNINATSLGGSINTGTLAKGYQFQAPMDVSTANYIVDPGLGGISTAAGGNVNLTAAQDVTSFLPTQRTLGGDAGSGAFGSAPGDVTVNAGGNVYGHFVVADGTGIINAGADAGTSGKQLALSVIQGGWSVNAGDSIYLQEIRNPNGVFNALNSNATGGKPSPSEHLFDYSPDAYLTMIAANGIELSGASLPRNAGTFEKNLPEIFPGTLNLTAGAGGITMDRDITLFPSPLGSVQITTTAGGNFVGTSSSGLTSLTMSDSADAQYLKNSAFTGHAPVPVHLRNPTTAALNISGDMNGILFAPNEAAQITVGGNMNNSRLNGQNLFAGDKTSLNVTGDIMNRNEFTTITLAAAPDFSLLNNAYPANNNFAALQARINYDPNTKVLTFQGRMNSEEFTALTALTVVMRDASGNPILDASGNPVTTTVAIIDQVLGQQLYDATQDIPTTFGTGYFIGGGGEFNVTARSLDLGATSGIQSVGPINNFSLANYFDHGAAINVNLAGDLNMFSTTISSQNGGDVNVRAGGKVNVGSTTFAGNDAVARGIFSAAKADVNVIAGGDINVNGSRIAAYDGGNVTVESLHGNINAGIGGRGVVAVTEVFVDSAHQIKTYTPSIPGSGILATTFPPSADPELFPTSDNTVGNILVETPNGTVNASAGGIVQLPFSKNQAPDAVVQVLAGYEMRDGAGKAVTAANLAGGTAVKVSDGRDIDASGSGVIGSTVKLQSSGSILGVIFARNTIDISAQQNVNVTALAQGSITANAGGNISGTLIGVGGVSASGGSIDAALVSNAAVSGNTSGQKGTEAGTAANAASSAASASSGETAKNADKSGTEDDPKKKKGIALAQKVSRVTVFLPTLKKFSETTSKEPKL